MASPADPKQQEKSRSSTYGDGRGAGSVTAKLQSPIKRPKTLFTPGDAPRSKSFETQEPTLDANPLQLLEPLEKTPETPVARHQYSAEARATVDNGSPTSVSQSPVNDATHASPALTSYQRMIEKELERRRQNRVVRRFTDADIPQTIGPEVSTEREIVEAEHANRQSDSGKVLLQSSPTQRTKPRTQSLQKFHYESATIRLNNGERRIELRKLRD